MPQMPQIQMVEPNLFVLSGENINVTYSTTGIDGIPHFNYQDVQQTRDFSGDEIRSVETEVGTLVSVTIRLTVDTGGTTFSILLPRVNIPGEVSVPIQTIGITTIHKSPIVPKIGQRDFYTVISLTGSASRLFF
jgi:hypothetical protein